MPALQSRSCDVDLLKLRLFYFSPSDSKGTVTRESNPIRLHNSNLMQDEVVTLARRSQSQSITAAGLRLFFGPLFDREPNYWALSAIFSVNNEVVEDRFVNWKQDFEPFIRNGFQLERAALEFKFEERSQPGDTLSVAVFAYSKDFQGRQEMVSIPLTVLSIRLTAERDGGGSMQQPEKDPRFLRERLHPFLPESNKAPQPRNPLTSQDPYYTEVPGELAGREASGSLGDELRHPSGLSLLHEIEANPRSPGASQSSSSRNLCLDLRREEEELESLRLQVKEKRERIKRLKERLERNESLDLDAKSSTASQPHSRISRATENKSSPPTQDPSDLTSHERELLGPSSILEEKRELNPGTDSLRQSHSERFKSNSPAPLAESDQANGAVSALVDHPVGEERAIGAIESENEGDYDSDSDRSLA